MTSCHQSATTGENRKRRTLPERVWEGFFWRARQDSNPRPTDP